MSVLKVSTALLRLRDAIEVGSLSLIGRLVMTLSLFSSLVLS